LKNKDTKALDYLYDHYAAALYGSVVRIVKNEDIASEVLQDVFLKIWERIGSYDPGKGRLFTWMINVARNHAIDKTRSREVIKSRKTDDIDLLVHKIDRTETGETHTDTIGLTEVLNRLTPDQRFVVDYLYLKGYTHTELAEEFNIPLGTVKTRLRAAMMELRSLLNVEDKE
jgi:RNA polymerase sigma-70 factor (ECF subfamily)